MTAVAMHDVGEPAPLAGIRVLDLTSVIMGPVCTQILGQYGAEVIKVEPPSGDIMRHAGASQEAGMGAMFLHVNHYKASVVIDLKQPEGRALLWDLIPQCDVLVHNIRPDAIARLGLDYDAVCAVRPDVVYLALTGYGQDGPYADKPAFDDVIQAQSGLAWLYAEHTGGAPTYLPALIADRHTGTVGAHRVLAALLRRQATGKGQYINVPMFETMAEFVLSDHLGGKSFDPDGKPCYSRLMTRYRRPYRTQDGHLAVLVYNDKHWRAFLSLVGDQERQQDARFVTAGGRAGHYELIYGYLAQVLQTRTNAQWLSVLTEADIPCASVNDIDGLLQDPHLQAIGFLDDYRHDVTGASYRAIRKLAGPARSQPPVMGQHTREVLGALGISQARINELSTTGVLGKACQDAMEQSPS